MTERTSTDAIQSAAQSLSKFVLGVVFGVPIMFVLGIAAAGFIGLLLSPFIFIAVFLYRVIFGG